MCFNGICGAMVCMPPLVPCKFGQCSNLLNDPFNCGGCGIVCAPGSPCMGGMCVGIVCPPNSVNCMGRCVDITTDPTNCGACFVVCGPGQACIMGQCH
jgi:hypothetical protein